MAIHFWVGILICKFVQIHNSLEAHQMRSVEKDKIQKEFHDRTMYHIIKNNFSYSNSIAELCSLFWNQLLLTRSVLEPTNSRFTPSSW